jgi:hypothetical protein
MMDQHRERPGAAASLRHFPGALLLALIGIGALVLVWFIDSVVQHTDPATPYYRSPDFFPRVSLLITAAGALTMALRHLRRGSSHTEEALPRTRPRLPVVLATTAAFGGYIVLVPWVGYPPATALFVTGGLIMAGRRPLSALLAGVGLAALLWLVFVWALGVWFPPPRLGAGG